MRPLYSNDMDLPLRWTLIQAIVPIWDTLYESVRPKGTEWLLIRSAIQHDESIRDIKSPKALQYIQSMGILALIAPHGSSGNGNIQSAYPSPSGIKLQSQLGNWVSADWGTWSEDWQVVWQWIGSDTRSPSIVNWTSTCLNRVIETHNTLAIIADATGLPNFLDPNRSVTDTLFLLSTLSSSTLSIFFLELGQLDIDWDQIESEMLTGSKLDLANWIGMTSPDIEFLLSKLRCLALIISILRGPVAQNLAMAIQSIGKTILENPMHQLDITAYWKTKWIPTVQAQKQVCQLGIAAMTRLLESPR